MWGQREEPDTRHHVIAWLSQSRRMWSVDDFCPQVAATKTMGYSSFN